MKINVNKVLLAMARSRLSDKELREDANISASTLAQIKAGRRSPTPKTIGKIAKALNVDATEIIEQEE